MTVTAATPASAVLQQLQDALEGLTTTERRIAAHLLQVWPEVPFISAAEVAQEVGVNPSSVTRLAQTLGFRGYPDWQRAVRQELRPAHVPVPHAAESQAAAHWQRELETFQALSRLPEPTLERCADRLAGAATVWVTGARGSAPAATYATHLWSGVRAGVRLLATDAPVEAWLDAGPGDLLVAFTVRRYARSTAALVQALTGRGAALLLITDSPTAPGARQASEVLVLPTSAGTSQATDGRFAPLAAPASVCALLAAKLIDRAGVARLQATERALGEQDVYLS